MDWPALWVCLVVIPLGLLWAGCFFDIIVRSRMSGLGKAGWILLVLVLPLIGALAYLIVRTPTSEEMPMPTESAIWGSGRRVG
jgi:hypothetical protein